MPTWVVTMAPPGNAESRELQIATAHSSRENVDFPCSSPGGRMLTFGVTVLPDPPSSRFFELIELAEGHGFEYAWTYDSHILWQESYATLPLAAARTSKIKLGHFVTNPGIRDPTITASWYATMQDLSNGRMVMGIGRGDSSRRVVGLKPVKVAGYGPKALAVAGRVADGVIIQLADPQIIQWIMDTARKAAEEAGRDPSELKCIVGAPSKVTDDLQAARDETRWFPAMVSNHVMDLIEKYGWESEIPAALTDYVKARKFYDYSEHSRVGARHGEFVSDEICDRFSVLGTPEQCVDKLRELESVGVDQFNIYLMTHGQEETLAAYGERIIQQFSQSPVA